MQREILGSGINTKSPIEATAGWQTVAPEVEAVVKSKASAGECCEKIAVRTVSIFTGIGK